jgi:hypothetical protein
MWLDLIAACWHFAYGIWLFAAKWGITSGEKARQRFLAVCLALFALMSVVGLVSLYTFRERFPQHHLRNLGMASDAIKSCNRNLRKAGGVKMAAPKIIVIGGGLAGLSAVIKIAEMGASVDLFSIVPVKRSHSVCAQGGINAAKNLKGEGDSTWIHFDDTVYGGDFLANQPPVKDMCEAAPGIIDLLDRMGVPFNRTPEGTARFSPLWRHFI